MVQRWYNSIRADNDKAQRGPMVRGGLPPPRSGLFQGSASQQSEKNKNINNIVEGTLFFRLKYDYVLYGVEMFYFTPFVFF